MQKRSALGIIPRIALESQDCNERTAKMDAGSLKGFGFNFFSPLLVFA
jgi:hypothetical protein